MRPGIRKVWTRRIEGLPKLSQNQIPCQVKVRSNAKIRYFQLSGHGDRQVSSYEPKLSQSTVKGFDKILMNVGVILCGPGVSSRTGAPGCNINTTSPPPPPPPQLSPEPSIAQRRESQRSKAHNKTIQMNDNNFPKSSQLRLESGQMSKPSIFGGLVNRIPIAKCPI